AITNVATARPDVEPMLAEAEEYPRRALARLVEVQIPRELPVRESQILRREMQSQAHEVLGQIAAKRGRWQDAVSEFHVAAESNPSPQGAQFFRLGAACAAVGSKDCAVSAFRRAGQLGPEPIRRGVTEALRKL